MAAVARGFEPPDSMNARVPCPLCGGLLHPIAGRCKHCKQDIHHRGRPAFPFPVTPRGALPQLASAAGQPGVAAVSLGASGFPIDDARGPGRSWLRNWPLIVILLAVIGMIVALLLLVLPQRDSSIRRGGTPLHNDPMDTNPQPGSGRSGAVDPWQSDPSSRAPRPSAPDPSDPAASPDPSDPSDLSNRKLDPLDPLDPSDPAAGGVAGGLVDPSDPSYLAGPDPGSPLAGGSIDTLPDTDVVVPDLVDPFDASDPLNSPQVRPTRSNFLTVMTVHLCQRAISCGADPVMTQLCQRMAAPSRMRPTRCFEQAKAMQCLRAIDSLSCSRLPTMSTLQRIPTCLELITC